MDNYNQFLINASPAKLIHNYKKLSIKVVTIKAAIWFNHKCLTMKITPRYILQKTNMEFSTFGQQLTKSRRALIKKELRSQYAKLDYTYTKKKLTYDKLCTLIHFGNLTEILTNLESEVRLYDNRKREMLKRKLIWWKSKMTSSNRTDQERKSTTSNLYKRFVNISNVNFSQEEITLIEMGLHHNPRQTTGRSDYEKLMVDVEVAIENTTIENKDQLKDYCAISLKHMYKKDRHKHKNNSNNNKVLLKNITTKIKDNDLVVTRADKGKTVVILHRQDYIARVEQFLTNNNFKLTNKFSTDSFNNRCIKLIKNSNPIITENLVNSLRVNNYQTPRLYGLMKLHKSNNISEVPIRPVVSFCNASTYHLARFLCKYLKNVLDFNPAYSVKNSKELIEKTCDIVIPNGTLASLDVSNLFTNIPPKEVTKIVKNRLETRNMQTHLIDININLLEFCLNQNVFQFNNKFWVQEQGLAMGSPISPLLADIYMDEFEEKLFNNINLKNLTEKIKFYHRYVDDILIMWTGELEELETFRNELNKIKNNLQFTLEIQNLGGEINFLDLTLKITNNHLEYNIFHKPTFTGQLIHFNSTHHYTHKNAAFHSLIHRLLDTPLNQNNFDKELNFIKHLALQNGYPTKFVGRLLKKKQLSKLRRHAFPGNIENTTFNNKNFVTLSYIGKPSYQIAKILENNIENIKVAFKNVNTLRTKIENNKDKINLLEKAGVYQLMCDNCNSIYIGKTYRHLKTRIKEHLNKKHFSQFQNHLKDTGHNFNIETGIKLLHQHKYNKHLLNFETLEIYKANNNKNIKCINSHNNLEMSRLFKIFD